MNTDTIIGEFNDEVDSIANYEERMEAYLEVEVTDENLALIGDFSDMSKEIHKIDHKVYDKSFDKRCAVCGRNNHITDNCRLKNASCYGCGKKGSYKEAHISVSYEATCTLYIKDYKLGRKRRCD